MGIFYKQRTIVNRAPVALTVKFDGQEMTLPPGESSIPEVAIPFAKNQNPIMGSQDPNNPHISGASYLIAVRGKWDGQVENCDPMTEEEWADHLGQPQRVNAQAAFEEKYGTDPKAKLVTLGKGRKTTATSRADAGSFQAGTAVFSGKE